MESEKLPPDEGRREGRKKHCVCCWVLVIILILLAAAVLLFPYTGIYNVAASAEHTAFGAWYLDTLKDHSIKARAEAVEMPADLYSQGNLRDGYIAFSGMCIICHGAPGVERQAIGKGITPQPPSLSEAATEWTAEQVFWILRHGIKLAGMPAFGVTHGEDELWAITAFVKQLPEMSAEEYRNFLAGGQGAADGHEHEHNSGTER